MHDFIFKDRYQISWTREKRDAELITKIAGCTFVIGAIFQFSVKVNVIDIKLLVTNTFNQTIWNPILCSISYKRHELKFPYFLWKCNLLSNKQYDSIKIISHCLLKYKINRIHFFDEFLQLVPVRFLTDKETTWYVFKNWWLRQIGCSSLHSGVRSCNS